MLDGGKGRTLLSALTPCSRFWGVNSRGEEIVVYGIVWIVFNFGVSEEVVAMLSTDRRAIRSFLFVVERMNRRGKGSDAVCIPPLKLSLV